MIEFDVTVIVRAFAERTKEICVKRLKNQFGENNVFVVENIAPFYMAVKRSYELGVEKGKKWTLIIDADLFFWQEGLNEFLTDAEAILKIENSYNRRLFAITSCSMDNFWGKTRVGGAHLYLTDSLRVGIEYVSSDNIRPETYVMRKMGEMNYCSYAYRNTIGIHDYFQGYFDIIRKGIQHYKKHSNIDELISYWERNKELNTDFYWILKGIEIGKKHINEIKNDALQLKDMIEMERIDIPEQKSLTEIEVEKLLDKLKNSRIPQYDMLMAPNLCAKSRNKQLKNALLQFEPFRTIKKVKDNARIPFFKN